MHVRTHWGHAFQLKICKITSVPKSFFFFFFLFFSISTNLNVWWHWLLPILTNKVLQVKGPLRPPCALCHSVGILGTTTFRFPLPRFFHTVHKKLWYACTPKFLRFSFKLFKKLTKLKYFRLPPIKNYELLRGKKINALKMMLHHCYYAT